MTTPIDESLCYHQPLADNVHKFVFVTNTREAIQEWAQHIERLQLAHRWYNRGHIRLLLDARTIREFPIRYLFEVLSDYNRAYPELEPPHLTMGFLHHPDTPILSIFYQFADLLHPPLMLRFFTDESQALRWLQVDAS